MAELILVFFAGGIVGIILARLPNRDAQQAPHAGGGPATSDDIARLRLAVEELGAQVRRGRSFSPAQPTSLPAVMGWSPEAVARMQPLGRVIEGDERAEFLASLKEAIDGDASPAMQKAEQEGIR